jgi:hypothetical protein
LPKILLVLLRILSQAIRGASLVTLLTSLGIEAALEEIEKNRGTHYDDAVSDACLRLCQEKGYQLP